MLALAEPQERAIRHGAGPLLLLGEAGTGKTEVLARRFARLAAEGTAPERVLVLASTRATAQRLRERVEALLDRPLEELWIGTWEQLGERLLREHSTAAGPRSLLRRPRPGRAPGDAARPPRRAAPAPPRDPRQPGRPARPPAGADRRAEGGLGAAETPSWPSWSPPTTASSPRPAASTAATSSSPSSKLLDERPDVRAADRPPLRVPDGRRARGQRPRPSGRSSPRWRRTTRTTSTPDEPGGEWGRRPSATRSLDSAVPRPPGALLALHERARAGAGGRARGRAPARRGDRAGRRSACWSTSPAASGGPVAAAMEERGIPFHLAGPAALFQRPEVRDAIAWLRVAGRPRRLGRRRRGR